MGTHRLLLPWLFVQARLFNIFSPFHAKVILAIKNNLAVKNLPLMVELGHRLNWQTALSAAHRYGKEKQTSIAQPTSCRVFFF
jgi:hypothetical protein